MPAATKTRTQTVTFVSRYSDLVLVRKPEIDQYVTGLGRQVLQRALRYEFHRNHLKVTAGKDVHQDSLGWLAPDADPDEERDVVEALKAHRSYGRDFWLQGHAPGTQYPRPQDTRKALQEAIGQLNEARVQEILDEERGSHNRADLIEECENALGVIGSAVAAIEAHKAEADAAKPGPKAK
jgi:hypothetical protein